MATKIGLDLKRVAAAQRMINSALGACEVDFNYVRSCIYTAIDSDRPEYLESLAEEYIKCMVGKLKLALSVAVSCSTGESVPCQNTKPVPTLAYGETEEYRDKYRECQASKDNLGAVVES